MLGLCHLCHPYPPAPCPTGGLAPHREIRETVCSVEGFRKLETGSHSPRLAVCPKAGCHPL